MTNEPKQEAPKQEAPQKQESKPSQPSNEPSKPAEQVTETKPEEPKKFQDGIYTGVADGFDGPIRVRVTVDNGKITGIEVLDHSDTPRFALGAFERITNNIILIQDC